MRSFRGGLLIGLAVAVAVGRFAITYERYDTHTLKRAIRRGEVLCGVNTGLPGFSIPTTRATGPASTSISAARSRRRSSTIRTRSFVPLDANERFKELQSARSTCCRAIPPGACRARLD